jgi:hypothetical protein
MSKDQSSVTFTARGLDYHQSPKSAVRMRRIDLSQKQHEESQ